MANKFQLYPDVCIWVPLTKTLAHLYFSTEAHLSPFPLCAFSSFPLPSIILHPSSYSPSLAPIRPSLSSSSSSQPEGQCLIMTYQSVMYSGHDSATDGCEKYTFSPPHPPTVPQLPIKNCPRLSSCALSCGGILKLGDLDAVEQGAGALATLTHNLECGGFW